MNDTKAWYTSVGTWGGILAVIVPLVGMAFHLNISDVQTQEIAAYLAAVGSVVAGGIALYGRIKATKQIAPQPPKGP